MTDSHFGARPVGFPGDHYCADDNFHSHVKCGKHWRRHGCVTGLLALSKWALPLLPESTPTAPRSVLMDMVTCLSHWVQLARVSEPTPGLSLIPHTAGGRPGLRAALPLAPLLGRSVGTRPLSLVLRNLPQLKASSGVSLQRKTPVSTVTDCMLTVPSSRDSMAQVCLRFRETGDHVFHLSLARPTRIQEVRKLVFVRLKISRPTFVLIYLQLSGKSWLAEL